MWTGAEGVLIQTEMIDNYCLWRYHGATYSSRITCCVFISKWISWQTDGMWLAWDYMIIVNSKIYLVKKNHRTIQFSSAVFSFENTSNWLQLHSWAVSPLLSIAQLSKKGRISSDVHLSQKTKTTSEPNLPLFHNHHVSEGIVWDHNWHTKKLIWCWHFTVLWDCKSEAAWQVTNTTFLKHKNTAAEETFLSHQAESPTITDCSS